MFLLNARLRLFENSLLAVDRLATTLGRSDPRAEHLRTGAQGEEAAFFYLRKHGFIVTARGWRSALSPGDIDLIAWEDDILCFIEVKTRSSRAVATAEAAVDEHKRRTLRRLGRAHIRTLPRSANTAAPSVRFDILSIYLGIYPGEKTAAEYELFRGAFGWS
jgi:putative endonuclease